MSLLLHYTGQDYVSRGLLKTELTPGSTSAIIGGCKTGKGFAFDGTANSSLSLSNLEENDSHTLSFWINFQANPSAAQIIAIHGQGGYRQFCIFIRNTNHIVISRDSSAGTLQAMSSSSANLLAPNTWHHITYTYINLIGTLYVNGVFTAQITYGSIRSGSDKIMQIGRFIVNALQGAICNFKYYDHALSQKEINEDYKSLMLHYKLDKPITTQVFDHSGFNRHIQVIENTTTNSTTEKRVYGGSLANDGTQSLYGACDLSDLNGLYEITVAARVKRNQTTNCCIVSNRISAGLSIFIYPTSIIFDFGSRAIVTHQCPTNEWFDIVCIKTSNNLLVYINGVSVASVSHTNNASTIGMITSVSHLILHEGTFASVTNGNIQDIRFYAKALTQEDVTELYQTRHEIDNLANGYCYELIEGQSKAEMKENGQLYCDEVIENDDGTFEIVQNKTIKTKEIKEI